MDGIAFKIGIIIRVILEKLGADALAFDNTDAKFVGYAFLVGCLIAIPTLIEGIASVSLSVQRLKNELNSNTPENEKTNNRRTQRSKANGRRKQNNASK